jgi:hypothetical protein
MPPNSSIEACLKVFLWFFRYFKAFCRKREWRRMLEEETASWVVLKRSEKIKVEVSDDEEAVADAEENIGCAFWVGECSELCGGGTEDCGSDEYMQHQGGGEGGGEGGHDGWDGEVRRLWTEERRVTGVELQILMNKVVSRED